MATHGKRASKFGTDSAKKRAKHEQDRRRYASLINLKEGKARWDEKKTEAGLNDSDFAAFLLDTYEQHQECPKKKAPSSSTPQAAHRLQPPELSSVAGSPGSNGSRTDTASSIMSGVNILKEVKACDTQDFRETSSDELQPDADDYTYEISDEAMYTDDDYDNVSYLDQTGQLTSELHGLGINTAEDQVFGYDGEDSDGDHDSGEDDILTGQNKDGSSLPTADILLEDGCCVAYFSCLKQLATMPVTQVCPKCNQAFMATCSKQGTALYMEWMCINGHPGFKWCSQPRLSPKGVHLGNFMQACSVLLSGNNYRKIALMNKFSGLGCVNRNTFDNIQAHYCFPAIYAYWETMQEERWASLEGKQVVLCGDGRNDSPGHCAMYCTYTLMDHEMKAILAIVIVDKREVDLKSPNMEKLGLQKALEQLQGAGVNVAELVTDAHTQIGSFMKKDFPNIEHQWDVWHGGKNLRKKLTAAGQVKENGLILEWASDVVNHFWFCCSKAAGSSEKLVSMWRGILHHTVDEHEWVIGDGETGGACDHGELQERTKSWFEPNSKAHVALRGIVLDKRRLNSAKYYKNFRHTGELEVFHNHLLMYAGKRFSFTYPAYKARNLLAAIDYNKHLSREVSRDRKGNVRYRKSYNKRSNQWSCAPLKVSKDYGYIEQLKKDIINKRLGDQAPLKKAHHKQPDDPRLLAATATKTPAPSVEEMLAKQVSRYPKPNDEA